MADLRHSTAAEFFGGMHDEYDDLIRRCVPRYDEMIESLVAYLPDRAERILELGCGTGNLTMRVAARFPNAHLTIVDASEEMVSLTMERLKNQGLQALHPVVASFEDLSLTDDSFDLIVSSIALHHVRDKAPLYSMIRRWLSKSGEFWFADQLAGATVRNNARNWSTWLEFCRRPSNCSGDEIKELLDHADAHDHYTPLPEHFQLLGAAGFDPDSLDCVWRNLIWGIIGAKARIES